MNRCVRYAVGRLVKDRSQTRGHRLVGHSGLAFSWASVSGQAAVNQDNKLGTGLWSTQVLNRDKIYVIGKRSGVLFSELIYLLQKHDVLDTVLRTGHW